jgi:hypothetical protein
VSGRAVKTGSEASREFRRSARQGTCMCLLVASLLLVAGLLPSTGIFRVEALPPTSVAHLWPLPIRPSPSFPTNPQPSPFPIRSGGSSLTSSGRGWNLSGLHYSTSNQSSTERGPHPYYPIIGTHGCEGTSCDYCLPQFDSLDLDVAPTGTGAEISWAMDPRGDNDGQGGYQSFNTSDFALYYGTTSPPTTKASGIQTGWGGAIVGLDFYVYLTGLQKLTVYYFYINATFTFGSCNGAPHNEVTYGSLLGIAFITSAGTPGGFQGGRCPVAALEIDDFSASWPSAGGQVNVSWKVTSNRGGLPGGPTGIATALVVTRPGGKSFIPDPTSPYLFNTSSVEYSLWLNASFPTASACISSTSSPQVTFYGGCQPTVLMGYVGGVSLNAPTQTPVPITGATVVFDDGSAPPLVATTTGSGEYFFEIAAPGECNVSDSGSIWAGALGYSIPWDPSHQSAPTAFSVSTPADETRWFNPTLSQTVSNGAGLYDSTVDNETGRPRIYDLNTYYPTFPSCFSVYDNYSSGVSGTSACLVDLGTNGAPTATPPNNFTSADKPNHGEVLELSGSDNSGGLGQASFVAYGLGNVTSPFKAFYSDISAPLTLTTPTMLQFNVYVPSTSAETRFSVDAVMSDGGLLSDEVDSFGHYLTNSQSLPCRADEMAYTPNQWTEEQCDLSGLTDVSITEFLLVFSNGGAFGDNGGNFSAYFDSIRLVNAVDPSGIVNGGFELPEFADGWSGGYQADLISNPPPAGPPGSQQLLAPYDGTQYALIGYPELCPQYVRCPGNQLSQVFRVPNSFLGTFKGTTFSPELNFEYYFLDQCPVAYCQLGGASGYFQVDVNDITHPGVPDPADNVNATGQHTYWAQWVSASINLTAFEGDLVQVVFSVNTGTWFYNDGNQYYYGSEYTTVGLDDVLTEVSNMAITQLSAPTSTNPDYLLNMTLPGSAFRPSCGVNASSLSVGLPIGFGGVTTAHVATDYYYVGTQLEQIPVMDNVSAGLDVWAYNACLNGVENDWLDFTVRVDANATGHVVTGNPSCQSCPQYDELDNLVLNVSEPTGPYFSSNKRVNFFATDSPYVGRNFSFANSSDWDEANYQLMSTIIETAAFIAAGAFFTIASDGLAIPLVFQVVLGAAERVAEAGISWEVAAYDQVTDGGTNCAAGTNVSCTFYATRAANGNPIARNGSIQMGFEAQVGSDGQNGGGHTGTYYIVGSVNAGFAEYDDGPPWSSTCGTPCSPVSYGYASLGFELEVYVTS